MIPFDYRRLDIRTPNGDWLCPACGFPGYFGGESFGEHGPLIGTGICPCCQYEPGFDDSAAASGCAQDVPIDAIRAYSAAWFDGGMVWRGDPSAIPAGWDRQAQREAWLDYCQPALAPADPRNSETATVTLWRPVGPEELALIEASGWTEFPPRLPEQPIFYPVTSREYAIKIARDWNVPASGSGFVTEFEVRADFLAMYPVETAGGSMHREHWIPAEDLPRFNRAIVGPIRVVDRYGAA